MNYFELHVGDYDKATAHLTACEDGIYGRLLRRYYDTEAPLTVDLKALQRFVRARTREEQQAVETILAEFFHCEGDGWHHKRCDAEIQRYQQKSQKARESVSKRWAKRDADAMPEACERNTNVDTNVLPTHNEGNTPRARPQTPDTRPNTKTLPDEANASSSSPGATADRSQVPCRYDAVVSAYHEALPMLPRVKVMDDKRKAAMRKRWAWVLSSTKAGGERRATTGDEAVRWFAEFFARAAGNDWLTGRTPSRGEHANWRADLDYLLTDRGLKAVLERTEVAA